MRHISWKPAALAAFVAAAALTPARAQTPEFEKARAALAQAAVARAEALKALEAADVAIKAAQAALGEASTTPAPPIPSREPPMKSNRDLNEDRLAVIGASRCLADVNSAEAIARKAQRYAEECLEFDEFRDYSVSNLNTSRTLRAPALGRAKGIKRGVLAPLACGEPPSPRRERDERSTGEMRWIMK